MSAAAYRGRGSHASCIRTYLHYLFSCFGSIFVLQCVVHFQIFNITFFKKRCVCQKRLFFSNKIIYIFMKQVFFNSKLFLRIKVRQTLLILIKQSLRYTLYFSMILYFEKTLCNVEQDLRFAFLFFSFYLTNYLRSVFTEFV